jgi:hypothetical protein
MLFSLFTGCRPAELVDGSKRKSAQQSRPVGDDVIDANATHDGDDDDDAENLDEVDNSDDPDYDRQDPWEDPNDNEYVEDNCNPSTARRCKALCYEDVRLWIVKDPTPGERDVLGMEITLAHHKGADRKPKPCVSRLRTLSCTDTISQDHVHLSRGSSPHPLSYQPYVGDSNQG